MTTPPVDPPPPARRPIDNYTPDALARCERALRTVLSKLGNWGPHVVLVGGLAPHYLFPSIPEGIEAHVGTTDLDLVIGICLPSEDEQLYRELEEALREARFRPSFDVTRHKAVLWRWERVIDTMSVLLEFLCPPDSDGSPGRPRADAHPKMGTHVEALRTPGAELAGLDYRTIILEGDTLDYGGEVRVELRVARLAPMIVLKAFAIEGRDKDKDAYDLVWVLNATSAGPREAAHLLRESSVADHPRVAQAIDYLAWHFASIDRAGPMRYARFFLGAAADAEDDRTRLARYAHGTVQEFLTAYRALGDASPA